jgi:restriction system protein
MALWCIKSGKHGENERKFLDDNRVCLTWNGLNIDLAKAPDQNWIVEKVFET